MIDQLLFRSSDLSLLDGDLFYSPNKIREQFTQSREKPRQEHIRELNILNNAFIFRQFVDRCHDNSDNLEPIKQFKSPGTRIRLIGKVSPELPPLFHHYEDFIEHKISLEDLDIPRSVIEHAVQIANTNPILHQENTLLSSNQDLSNNFDKHHVLALYCTALFKMHCIGKHSKVEHNLFLDSGINASFIALALAIKEGANPLKVFMTTLIHHIGLLYLAQEIEKAESLANEIAVQSELNHIANRLGYWIAKDWGVPENILMSLKERFQQPYMLGKSAAISQKAEHANLALNLYHENLLSKRQLKIFLTTLGINEALPLDQIITSTH